MLTRALLGLIVASAVAWAALRARALTASGAVAAAIVGTVAVAAGWDSAALLLVYFVSSTLLSRHGASQKALRTAGMIDKDGARDAWQVSANGAVFTICLLVALVTSGAVCETASLAAICALSASAADTWATEIGTLVGHTPRSLLTLRPMKVGESGGVTLAGWLGALGGATIIAATSFLFLFDGAVASFVILAGMLGTTVDSLIGATVQHRRWCDPCGDMTEMRIHSCGAPTRHLSGIAWIDNDVVNLASTLAGAMVPVIILWLLSRPFT